MSLDFSSAGRVPSPPSPEVLNLTYDQESVELNLDQVTPTSVARIFSVCFN